MVGVSYGKGASVPDADVRWVSVKALSLELSGESGGGSGDLLLLDCRDLNEHERGSIPGARPLPQTGLMFQRNRYASTSRRAARRRVGLSSSPTPPAATA